MVDVVLWLGLEQTLLDEEASDLFWSHVVDILKVFLSQLLPSSKITALLSLLFLLFVMCQELGLSEE